MQRKRRLPETTTKILPNDNCDRLFTLGEEELIEFWNLGNSIALAEVAIEKKVRNPGGVASYLTELNRIEQYVVKVYSSNIKSHNAPKSKILETIFKDLEDYDTSSDIIDGEIQQYLTCCISCCSNFSSGIRSSLLKTLAKMNLVPTIKIISTVKGGLPLFIDWLRELYSLSTNVSDHMTDVILQLLKFELNVARPSIEVALQSLIEQSTEFKMSFTSVLWRELWLHVDITPSATCKRQALALLQYAITVQPDLIRCPKEIERTFERHNSSLNHLVETSSSSLKFTSYLSGSAIQCEELLPLIIVCYAENDLNAVSTALNMLVNFTHASITRWTLKLKSQAPTAIWNSVLQTIVECFRVADLATTSSKGSQYKILLALKQIIDRNPFGRNFDDKCTAQESVHTIKMELDKLRSIQEVPEDQLEGQHLTKNAIEFLTEELSFVNTLQTGIHRSLIALLVQGSVRGIADRSMNIIGSILQGTCCGVDPGIVMKHLQSFHKDICNKIKVIVCNRSTHEGGFLETSFSAFSFMKKNIKIDSSQHILKSPGYHQLLHLSHIFVEGNTKADVADMVQSLLKRLRNLLEPNNCSWSSLDNFFSYKENLDSVVVILLSLSVLPMECYGNTGRALCRQLCSLYDYFLNAIVDIKKQVLDKSVDAAMYCTAWLLFLAQAKKMTAPLHLADSSESDLFSKKSLESLKILLYPDLLADSCVMPSAILFAMQMKDPQQLLFESIGHLQDSAFDGEETDTGSIVHYSNLIATVILENSKIVKDSARAKIYPAADRNTDRAGSEGIVDPNAILAASAINPDAISSYSMVVESKSDEDDPAMVDYMTAANLLEQANQVEMHDLERSVSASDSFLACFLPLFIKLTSADELPEEVRLGALRTLSAYMKCSKTIFIDHILLLEEFIIHCPLDAFGHRLNHLRIESTLVWMENFTVTPLTLTVPVRALLDYFEASRLLTKVAQHSGVASATNVDEVMNQKFLITLLHCMYCLLKEHKLRDEAECTVAIGLPLAFISEKRIVNLQKESAKILKEIFVNHPQLFTRTLFQLCIPLQSTKSLSLNQTMPDSVSNLVEERINQSGKLMLIKTIIRIAQDEEELKSRIDDVDRALTDEVIRCNNSFAFAALQYLKMTTESANAIKEADELGILNTLDPALSKELKNRLGARHSSSVHLDETSNV